MFCTVASDTRRHLDSESARAAAAGVSYANHLHEAREALIREPGKALRNPHSTRCPTIRASDLLESLSYEQQAAMAEVLSREAMAGDAQALKLIDQIAAEHAERNSEECDE